jgi:hypothetical protein
MIGREESPQTYGEIGIPVPYHIHCRITAAIRNGSRKSHLFNALDVTDAANSWRGLHRRLAANSTDPAALENCDNSSAEVVSVQ